MKTKEYSTRIGDKDLICEFNDLADQAHGSVLVRYGNSLVLATAVMSKNAKEGLDYFPLSVDYEEKFYAAGAILGSRFMKREGRPSDEAILSGRIVDRTIRPLFDQNLRNEVQVVITVLSIEDYDPDVLAVVAASLALGTSDIPWNGPVSGLRIGKKKGETTFTINPSYKFMEDADFEMEMVICGKDRDNINMIEVGSTEISESLAEEAFNFAANEIEKIQKFQAEIIKERAKEKKSIEAKTLSPDLQTEFELFKKDLVDRIFVNKSEESEVAVKTAIGKAFEDWMSIVSSKSPDEKSLAAVYLENALDELIHSQAVSGGRRVDGRKFDEIRPLFAKAGGVSPVLHGSGIFYRGGTHVFSALTLGGPQDAQIIDGMEVQEKKRFMHHYNFPPFSSGETGRMSGTNRRMIGHGALAEKALIPVIPPKETFPYTIRLVSESMASNGSTSMASVCASSLSLMDGGVPISRPVAGIAMGLMMEDKDNYKVLTDIQGPEDHYGDMDFKVAGTRSGITAIQLDIKLSGIPVKILIEALNAALKARLQILDVIEKEIAVPRDDLSASAPRIMMIKILPSKIGLVIGGGGKTINEIKEKTGTEIEIEDDGSVFITGQGDGPKMAKDIIESMTHEFISGERLNAKVVRIVDFGAFVELNSNTDGLVHISEIAPFRVNQVKDVLKEGDIVPIVVKGVDERGKIKLSIKDADPKYASSKVPADYAAKSHPVTPAKPEVEKKKWGFIKPRGKE